MDRGVGTLTSRVKHDVLHLPRRLWCRMRHQHKPYGWKLWEYINTREGYSRVSHLCRRCNEEFLSHWWEAPHPPPSEIKDARMVMAKARRKRGLTA
jgi:hypothetical protein